jgi:CHAT domain-containing protein/lipopolysaccharide biosynthesis regulator YciM
MALLAGQGGGRDAQTRAQIQQILEAHPRYGAALRLRAKLASDEGRPDEAVSLLRRAIEADPAYFAAYESLVQIHHALGRAAKLASVAASLPEARRRSLRAAAITQLPRFLATGIALSKAKRKGRAFEHYRRAAEVLLALDWKCLASMFLVRAAQIQRERRAFSEAARTVERGARLCAEERHYALAAERFVTLGAFRKMAGDYPGALAAYREAEEMHRREGDRAGLGQALARQVTELTNLSRWREAEDVFARGLRLARRLRDRDLEAEILIVGGNSCGHRSAFRCALRRLRATVALREEIGPPSELSTAQTDLGKTLSQVGEVAEAIQVLERALALDQGRESEQSRAGTYVNLGAAYRARGDHIRALEMYRKAAEGFARVAGMERFQAVAVANIGNVYRSMGFPERALAYHEQALALKKGQANQRELATAMQDIAIDLDRLGRRPEAIARVQEALVLFEASGDREGHSQAQSSLAGLESAEGRHDQARALLEKAIATQQAVGLPLALIDSLRSLAVVEMVQGRDSRKALAHLARARAVASRLGHPVDWRTAYLEGEVQSRLGNTREALSLLTQAQGLIDEERRGLRAETFKTSFLAGLTFVYHNIARLALRLAPKDAGSLETAFQALERGKARSLLDLIETARVPSTYRGAAASLLARERRLSSLATFLQKRLSSLSAAPPSAARDREVERLTGRRRQVLDDLDAVRAEIQASNPMVATAAPGKPVSLARLQKELLPPGTALLEYSVGEESTLLFVVTRERVAHYLLPLGRKALSERIAQYRDKYLTRREILRPKGFVRDGLALHRDLLGIVDPALLASRDLLVVPDGPLAYLPFEALLVEGDPERKAWTFLLERHAVSYLPSASVMAALEGRLRRNPPAKEGFAAVGDPVYDFASFAARRVETGVAAGERTRAYQAVLERLPATQDEVRRIATLFPGKSRLLVRQDALEERLKQGALDGHRFVHIASHGILNDNFQALALTLDPRSREDGFLELREIYHLPLQAELVVLSACQTGEGRLVSGEGIVGLTHAFLFAGAPRVVVSLWKVGDLSTAELMVEMYRRLGPAGAPRAAQALREAKLALLRGTFGQARSGAAPSYAAPYFWAPFIAVGLP